MRYSKGTSKGCSKYPQLESEDFIMNNKEQLLPKGIRFKNGSYEARANVNGIQIRLYSTDLKKLQKDFEAAKEQAKNNVDYKKKAITLNEWFNDWFDNVKARQLKQTSVYPMKSRFIKTFGFYLGEKKLKDITPMDVQNALNAMQDAGKSTGTMRDVLGTLRQCMEFAVANRYIGYNPCTVVEVLPWNNKIIEKETALTQEEQNQFLEQLEKEQNWYREMFYVMFLTGVRVGELGALCWEDIDFKHKYINVRNSLSCSYANGVKTEAIVSPKTVNSYRRIPFIGEAEEMLLAWKEKQETLRKQLGQRWRAPKRFGNLVFCTSMGSPTTRYIVLKEIKNVIKRIREQQAVEAVENGAVPEYFRDFHPHTIRHTFATRCFEVGMEPKVVQKLLGHSSIATTLDIYTHVLEEKQMSEVAKFGKAKTDTIPQYDIAIPQITAKSHV